MDKKFKINFFELGFLIEACIPPGPIARSMFWNEVINVYYHEMSVNERARLHEWINKNWVYQERLEEGNEEVEIFEARFNPDNQYMIFSEYKGVEDSHECFLYKDKYYTEYYADSRTRWVSPDHIKNVKKIDYVRSNS